MSKGKIYDPEFGSRVSKILHEKFNGNSSAFARALNVAVSSLNRWTSGEADPSRSNILKISEVAQVDIIWLMTGIGEPYNANIQTSSSEDYIGIKDMQLTSSGLVEKRFYFRKSWINKLRVETSSLSIFRVKDDSMEPTIQRGDVALIETFFYKKNNDIKHGLENTRSLFDGLYVVRISERLTLRRLQFDIAGKVSIKADNSLYIPLTVTLEELLEHVVGRVLWHCHEHNLN